MANNGPVMGTIRRSIAAPAGRAPGSSSCRQAIPLQSSPRQPRQSRLRAPQPPSTPRPVQLCAWTWQGTQGAARPCRQSCRLLSSRKFALQTVWPFLQATGCISAASHQQCTMKPLSEDKVQEAISGGAAARSAVVNALDQLHVPCLLAEAARCQELTLKGPSHSANALNPRNRQPANLSSPSMGSSSSATPPGGPGSWASSLSSLSSLGSLSSFS